MKIRMANSSGFSPRNGEIVLKMFMQKLYASQERFSPRNGEIVLKRKVMIRKPALDEFQSPQWGDCSKVTDRVVRQDDECFSPRNGEIVLK